MSDSKTTISYDVPAIAKELISIRDVIRWGVSHFNEAELFYGHGMSNALDEAVFIEKLGSQMLIVECIDEKVTKTISRNLHIPVIGIGSGKSWDWQIRVIYDLFEISFNGIPGFLKSKNKKLNPMRTIMKKYITNTNKYKL